MPYIKRTVKCGNINFCKEYFAPHYQKKFSRADKKKETSIKQGVINTIQAMQRLAWKIANNFSRKAGDLWVNIDYKAFVTREQAMNAVTNYIRSLKYYAAKHGLPEIKYVIITECQGGKWHHHIPLSKMPMEVVIGKWKHGRCTVGLMDEEFTYETLAKYVTAEEKPSRKKNPSKEEEQNAKKERRKNEKRWSGSRNLKDPEIEKKILMRAPRGDPKPPKGFYLLPGWKKECDTSGNIYLEYMCMRI